MNVTLKNCYISCGCNKVRNAADWSSSGLICFGSFNSVAVYQASVHGDESKIIQILHGHTGRVNSVRWLRRNSGFTLPVIISASSDNTARVWSYSEEGLIASETELKGHTGSVTVGDALSVEETDLYSSGYSRILVATASSDSTVKIWRRDDKGGIQCTDTISFGTGFALDVRLALLCSKCLVACAADDSRVHLFCGDPTLVGFQKLHVIVGHEDWITSMDFFWADERNLYLATGSQDTFVRVYKFSVTGEGAEERDDISSDKVLLEINQTAVEVELETVLAGHENWVYGVSWSKGAVSMQLVTGSMDKTLVVWAPRDGLWMEIARVGEVGGNTLGFYGVKFGPDGRSILGHGYQGSFHLWRLKSDDVWEPEVVVGGHCGEVTDVAWATNGAYLLSCGQDQTTRLHAPWQRDGKNTWHEISRPQVHGHDMACVACISDTQFVSGAEEIVLRAFAAPRNFLDNFKRICGVKLGDNDAAPEGASVPALGLSNKPVFIDGADNQKDPDLCFSPLTLHRPPTEENLLQNTLWPELQKLYGHGYEIRCVAARPDGALIASACKATQTEHAAVILWETKTWTQVQKLIFHQLSVLQMAFSPDGRHLLTVSRDRKWCLYKLDDLHQSYVVAHTGVKTPHTRVIWCCAWSHDGSIFATGSRDGNICLWDVVTGSLLCTVKDPLNDSVTALDFSPPTPSGSVFLVSGTDSGTLHVYLQSASGLKQLYHTAHHGGTIQRVKFRPHHGLQFVSCSSDYIVRISDIAVGES